MTTSGTLALDSIMNKMAGRLYKSGSVKTKATANDVTAGKVEFDFEKRGWIVKRFYKTVAGVPMANGIFERTEPLDKRDFDIALDYTMHNLRGRFPDMTIESRKVGLFRNKVEICGMDERTGFKAGVDVTRSDRVEAGVKKMFIIDLTNRNITMKAYGIDAYEILGCIA